MLPVAARSSSLSRLPGIWTDTEQTVSAARFVPQDSRRDAIEGLRDKAARLLSDKPSVTPTWMQGMCPSAPDQRAPPTGRHRTDLRLNSMSRG